MNHDDETSEPLMDPDGHEWEPVDIEPRTPNTVPVRLHHRHAGFVCTACEIIALRKECVAARGERKS